MLNRKSYLILLVAVLITILFGCGGGSSNLDVSTSSSGAQLKSISITPTNPTMAVDTSQQFTATGIYSDNTTRDLTSLVTWSSSAADAMDVASSTQVAQFTGLSSATADKSNASYSPGHLKATGPGKAKITGSSGGTFGSTTVTVTTATLVSIAITPTNPSIAKGTNQQLIATGTFSDNTTQDLTTSVIWSSSDAAVAVISNTAGSNGLATTAAAGSTTITAISGSISGSTTLTVTPATLVSITVTPTNPSIVKGTTRQFTATGTYSDSSTQNLTTAVTWNSSAAGVAAISNAAGSNGLATSVAAGSTTITAISGSISGTATLTVTSGGVVTLTWDAPTTNTDGSPLNPATDLTTYRIYYGTASQTYTQTVNVTNPGTTTITKTLNLSSGTYYFVVTTVNTSGQESSYSNEDMKTI